MTRKTMQCVIAINDLRWKHVVKQCDAKVRKLGRQAHARTRDAMRARRAAKQTERDHQRLKADYLQVARRLARAERDKKLPSACISRVVLMPMRSCCHLLMLRSSVITSLAAM